jgi:hypothetical protein
MGRRDRAVKFFKGNEYTIDGPRALWNVVTDVVSSIANSPKTLDPPLLAPSVSH